LPERVTYSANVVILYRKCSDVLEMVAPEGRLPVAVLRRSSRIWVVAKLTSVRAMPRTEPARASVSQCTSRLRTTRTPLRITPS
jgi:hypothetical protein